MDADTILKPGQQIKPPGGHEIAADLLRNVYGMKATKIHELNAYDDRNYHVKCEEYHTNSHVTNIDENGYVLKIVNSLDSQKTDVTHAQTEMLLFLNQRNINCPVPIKNTNGDYYSIETLYNGDTRNNYIVRLLNFHPGELLHRVPITSESLYNVGRFTARLDDNLLGFSHPAYDSRKTMWMLTSVPKLRQFTYAVMNAADREVVHEVILAFEKEVLPVTGQLEQGVIHGDMNEQNIVMCPNGTDIAAVIDFGDSHRTCLVFELAVALCYMILQAGRVSMGKSVIDGYESIRKLSCLEKRILKIAVCARMCQSLVMGAYSHLHDPQNEYLLSTQKKGWSLLKELWPLNHEDVLREWGLKNWNETSG